MKKISKRRKSDESGQAMVEYALIIALVALLLIGTLVIFKDSIANIFNEITESINGAVTETETESEAN